MASSYLLYGLTRFARCFYRTPNFQGLKAVPCIPMEQIIDHMKRNGTLDELSRLLGDMTGGASHAEVKPPPYRVVAPNQNDQTPKPVREPLRANNPKKIATGPDDTSSVGIASIVTGSASSKPEIGHRLRYEELAEDCTGRLDKKWRSSFQQLVAFREAYGHCRVPMRCPQNPSLASWVKRQR